MGLGVTVQGRNVSAPTTLPRVSLVEKMLTVALWDACQTLALDASN